jgi:hypothetical protein
MARFSSHDARKLLPAMIARIATQFHLPEDRTKIQRDLHYQAMNWILGESTLSRDGYVESEH